jgi:O-antigen ligase/tetratricopeptide (TPR) repeat protein
LLDDIAAGLVIVIVVFAPFALGAVHPWPASFVEISSFLLVIVWASKIAFGTRSRGEISFPRYFPFLLPVSLLAGLFLFQLVPLPPGVIRRLSPSTYEVYARALPGWPKTAPYSDGAFYTDSRTGMEASSETVILPSVGDVRQGAPVPIVKTEPANKERAERRTSDATKGGDSKSGNSNATLRFGAPTGWYPLSVAPSLTRTALLRFAAYSALFFVVLGYSFTGGSASEDRFRRLVLAGVLITGLLVAVVGLVERVYWNGKILWLFVPRDWGAPLPGVLPRATGPFVDPDHFANYLAMVFPLALAGALFGFLSVTKESANAIRVLCGIAAFVILTAVLLSLSRAGWIETVSSGVILSLLWFSNESAQHWRRDHTSAGRRWLSRTAIGDRAFESRHIVGSRSITAFPKTMVLGASLAAVSMIVLLVLFIAGPEARTQSDARFGQAVTNGGDIGVRPIVWRETIEMSRAFPVFGMGLAAWPELFPHYEAGPWSPDYFREAHNDYLQYAAETGLIGLVGLVWFFVLAGANLFGARNSVSRKDWPILVALALALGSMAFHELVDFCLHIPANALLFTLFLAIAVRMAMTGSGCMVVISHNSAFLQLMAGAAMAVSAMLIVLALLQKGLAYPYDIAEPTSPAQARAVVLAHPANAQAHLSLLALAGPNMTPGMRLDELASAVWLDPTNPFSRDLYAGTLARAGSEKEALKQIRESVCNSPTTGTHPYLDGRLIPWLLPAEQNALEQGFGEAIAAGYSGAVDGLGSFYEVLGRLSDESHLFQDAARKARSSSERERYFRAAAETNVRAGNTRLAVALFRQAIRATPSDPEPYTSLITQVYGPAKDSRAAKSLVAEGIRKGADATQLYVALASAAQAANDPALTEDALLKALALDPTLEVMMRVGQFYLGVGQFEKAVSMLERAVETDPDSADAFYLLGVAEEHDYQYAAADKSYGRAEQLDPQRFRAAYLEFRHRIEKVNVGG